MKKFKKITVDISNVCNAKCKWCTTGRKNRICQTTPEYMDEKQFGRVLNYCIKNQIIEDDGIVFESLMVHGHTVGGADGILTAVALADGVFFIVVACEIEAETVLYFACLLGKSIFLHQR